jgi:hypothetical protein
MELPKGIIRRLCADILRLAAAKKHKKTNVMIGMRAGNIQLFFKNPTLNKHYIERWVLISVQNVEENYSFEIFPTLILLF